MSRDAAASGSVYYDFAGGVAKYQQTSPFFGAKTNGSTNYGYALNNGVFVNWGSDTRVFAFQVGVQHRLSSAADSTYSYAIQAAYPVFRLQFTRIYLGMGYTPFVWRRTNVQSGLDMFSRAQSTSAFLGEAGVLWPITPKFSFGTQASMQILSNGGTQSPKPVVDGTVSLRFYFGFFGKSGSHNSGEFTGWRYPFGMIR